MTHEFELVAAAFTPLNDDGSVNLEGIAPSLELMKRQGVDTVFVCGSTGEGLLLTIGERRAIAERWVKEGKGQLTIIVHVGHSSPTEARDLAVHAAEIGADAISAVAPFYFRPATVDALVESCAIIASGAPELPFYYYHAPAQTGVRQLMAPFLVAATKAIPNFAGIKFTNEDLNDFANCLALAGPGQRIYFGRDEILLASLAMGAQGAIGTTYSFLAPIYRSVVDSVAKGDLAAAQAAQATSRCIVDIALSYGGFPAFKLMSKWAGADCGPVRAPLQNLSAEEERGLRAELDAAGVLHHITGAA